MQSTFIPPSLNNILNNLTKNGNIDKRWFIKEIINFYTNIVSYLELQGKQFEEITHFKWITLKYQAGWKNIEGKIVFMKKYMPENEFLVLENELFEEISYLKANVNFNNGTKQYYLPINVGYKFTIISKKMIFLVII